VELYTLDALLRRTEVFDTFESFIWTERYDKYGDFELDITSTLRARTLLKVGTLLAMNLSHYVMVIETVGDGTDSENRKMLKVKGRSLEVILYDRVAKESLSDTTTSPTWEITGLTATAAARKIFHDICVTGILSSYDVIPFIYEGTFLAASTIAEPVDLVTIALEPTTVYDAIVQIADIWKFGFRLLREYDTSKLWFDVYTGRDRTTSQTTNPAVVFTPELDNLQNTNQLITIEGSKNVAYVYSPDGFEMVYADDVDPDVSGFERRALVINATDITTGSVPDVSAALIQRGQDELAKAKTYQAFDGEINPNSSYVYGTDYNLGDLIELRDVDGVTNVMRVTEQIFVSDREGQRSYPTFTINQFINTGSWLSWLNSKMWAEMTTEEWIDQP
jgi:hypothetical protein